MKHLFLATMLAITTAPAWATCGQTAEEAAKAAAAVKWSVDGALLKATVLEDDFSENLGRGTYVVSVEDADRSLSTEYSIDIIAFSEFDDSDYECMVDDVYELVD